VSTHFGICPLCEATCGVAIEYEGPRIIEIRGDDKDPLSRGYICPKAVALQDLHEDPDRLRQPVAKVDGVFVPIGWDEAFERAGQLLGAVRKQHGKDALAFYYGNPTVHSYGAMIGLKMFIDALATSNVYSTASVDALPRQMVSYLLYGNQAAIPIPDLDRTGFLLILGANPVVSNGSVMTAPDMKRRLKELRARGARLVVVDPRRTQTADLADQHHFIRPGADPLLLLALLQVITTDGAPGKPVQGLVDGLDTFTELCAPFTPERVASATGITAEAIRSLARSFAAAESAVCYGRLGICAHEFGALTSWLIDVLNIVTGNLDRAGGAMFTTPAVDLVQMARWLKQTGSYNTFKSRISGLPEFNGELPVAVFAEEMETPGDGQIRALLTHAGNPSLSLPNAPRIDAALANLDAMVSVDIYINETTRHADIIIPPPSLLERDHYPLIFHALSVRNHARFSSAMFPKAPDAPEDWEILIELQRSIRRHTGGVDRLAGIATAWAGRLAAPRRVVDWAMRLGPHDLRVDSLIREHPHGVDLGPLESRLPGLLSTPNKRIALVPTEISSDLARAERWLTDAESRTGLELIGRRTLRSNNSWMHNSKRLTRGRHRCTLLMHPDDAAERRLADGQVVAITSRIGSVQAPLVVSDEVMPGIVSLPHGWGHTRRGAQLGVAAEAPGVSMNDLTDESRYDVVSGASSLAGVPVEVTAPGPG
jgi:anaerobic selenocysteine-containing dehydrogenase